MSVTHLPLVIRLSIGSSTALGCDADVVCAFRSSRIPEALFMPLGVRLEGLQARYPGRELATIVEHIIRLGLF